LRLQQMRDAARAAQDSIVVDRYLSVDDGSSPPDPLTTPQYRQLLTGMLAQGHGIDALCLFLAITRDVLLDLVVQFDLPGPHERPYRRAGGARAWGPADYAVLLSGWLGNWRTGCIAEQIGRSRGSIWAKSRRLGLPKRDRRSLFWPESLPSRDIRAQADPSPVDANDSRKAGLLPPRWWIRGTKEPIELTSKRGGREVHWTTPSLIELGMRKWAGQRIQAMAEDFCVSIRTITSQLHWLEIPSRPRSEHTDHFDRAVAEANIQAADYKMVFCKSNSRFPYWTKRTKWNNAKRDKEFLALYA
jgi:hypothetical protein